MPAEVESALDVALWFSDQALRHNEYLQPQKLHKLMFLAQAYFAVAYEGRKLMPGVFVAEELGPIEPNVFKVFARGRPDVDPDLFFTEAAEEFLRSIWRRFGHYSPDRLARLTNESDAFRHAFKRGRRAEISFEAMRISFVRTDEAPDVAVIVKPKVLRTATGRPVSVKAWKPAAADRKKKPAAQRIGNAGVKEEIASRAGKKRAAPGRNASALPTGLKDSPVLEALAKELLKGRRRGRAN